MKVKKVELSELQSFFRSPVRVAGILNNPASALEQEAVTRILQLQNPDILFDFSTNGKFADLMAVNSSPHAIVYSVNVNGEGHVNGHNPKIMVISEYSVGEYIDKNFLSRCVDFTVVEDQNREHMKYNTRRAFQICRPGGTIIWNGYNSLRSGEFKIVEKLSEGRPLFYIARTGYLMFRNNS